MKRFPLFLKILLGIPAALLLLAALLLAQESVRLHWWADADKITRPYPSAFTPEALRADPWVQWALDDAH